MDKYKNLEQRILFLEAIAGILDSPIANKALEIFQEEFKKNIARRKQSEPQPLIGQVKAIPWAPWVKWVAMDETGDWFAYEELPIMNERGQWEPIDNSYDEEILVLKLPTFPDWRESKVRVNDE